MPTDTQVIRDALVKLDAALLVIDPLMAYLDDRVNAHRDQDIRRALAPLMRVADDTGAAVILVRHLTKGDSSNAVYRGGSIGIIGAARLGYAIAHDPHDDTRAVLAPTKANIAAMPTALAYRLVHDERHGCARIVWHGPVGYTATDLLRPPAEPDQTTEWLTGYLTDHDGQAPASEVFHAAEQAGIAARTLQRARSRARVITRREGFPSHTVWRLPSSPDASHATPSKAGATGTTGATGATGATRQTRPTDIGPCARCGGPTRRYGPDADGPTCTNCRNTRGRTA
ncbi:MAG: AAA family ATPase [Streptosporangiales bacterium]